VLCAHPYSYTEAKHDGDSQFLALNVGQRHAFHLLLSWNTERWASDELSLVEWLLRKYEEKKSSVGSHCENEC
jgi:hypothetical protein